ncbi:MAG: hypothetical protein F6K03_13930, partial [Kamptonema sp. SIO4C4]|nr:hypothetical protein [Kamptonema sp. SIO4C4]
EQSQVSGVIYQTDSEYACLRGQVEGQQLSLQVHDPTAAAIYSLAIALDYPDPIAGQFPQTVNLQGYHRLETLSDLDRALLANCQANSV